MSQMPAKEYRILRNSYSDIRSLFQKTTRDIVEDNDLPLMAKPADMHDRLVEITKEFRDEMDCYRNSIFAKGRWRWSRVTFSHMSRCTATIGATIDLADNVFTGGLAKPFLAGAVVAVNILGPHFASMRKPETNADILIRRLCSLEKKTNKRLIKSLA
jgi:hypothetical protein